MPAAAAPGGADTAAGLDLRSPDAITGPRTRRGDGNGNEWTVDGQQRPPARMAKPRPIAAGKRRDRRVREPRARPRGVHRRDASAGGVPTGRRPAGNAVPARRGVQDRRAPLVHRRPHRRRGHDGARAGHAALRQSHVRMARRRLCVSVTRKSRCRSLAHADRRARDRGTDQGKGRRAAHVRGGEGRWAEGNARRAGATEPVHDQRRAYRPR